MKTREELEERLAKIEADDRIHYSPALVQVNAPLALEQVALKKEANTLRWVLDLPHKHYGNKDEEDEEMGWDAHKDQW